VRRNFAAPASRDGPEMARGNHDFSLFINSLMLNLSHSIVGSAELFFLHCGLWGKVWLGR